MAYGTLSLSDLLAVNSQSVAEFGEQRTFDAIDAFLAAHNMKLREMTTDLVDVTTDRQRRVGGVAQMGLFEKLDEFGRADAEKVGTFDTVGFPLDQFGKALQWTRLYMEMATPAELGAQVTALATADNLTMQSEIRKAIFLPTNRTNIDRLVDKVTLAPVKALQNGDGAQMMPSPYGDVFDGATHTHYLAKAGASVGASDVDALVSTVVEHYISGQALIYINKAQEATIRAFTSNFDRYVPSSIMVGNGVQVGNGTLDTMNVGNRAIGVWNGTAEVWVKPWIPAGYMFCWVRGQDKPIVMRERRPGSGALRLDYDNEQHPLRARQLGREYGFGAWSRTNGAVLDTTHQTNYAAPSSL